MEIIQVHQKIKKEYCQFLLQVFLVLNYLVYTISDSRGVAQPGHTDTRMEGQHFSV